MNKAASRIFWACAVGFFLTATLGCENADSLDVEGTSAESAVISDGECKPSLSEGRGGAGAPSRCEEPARRCTSDSHCPEQTVCELGTCTKVECTKDSHCDSGEVCDTDSNTCQEVEVGCQVCPGGKILFSSDACNFISSAAPNFEPGTPNCKSIADMAESAGCCDSEGPPGECDFEPPEVQYVGPNPPCDLCRDGDYPHNTSMVLNFLYLGAGSCAQYYEYGLAGKIPQHMCDTVKYFAYEPCGCGEFNPCFTGN